MILILSCCADILGKDAEEERDILLLDLICLLNLRIQRSKLMVYSDQFMIPVIYLDI